MSTKLSFKEALARPADVKDESRDQSAFPARRFVLIPHKIVHPVEVAITLKRHGMSLRRAHDTLNRLAARERVAVELRTADEVKARNELSALGVEARPIHLPTVDVKRVRERFGLSQAEFAIRFGFEIDTVQNWEQGRNRPDQATQLLLKVIEAYPEDVDKILAGSESQV